MAKHNQILDTVDECITNGVTNKILHLNTEDEYADGRVITIRGRKLVNFASYSYLGLETDERLKQGGIEALQKYGTQFGASRAYVSIKLYEEMEGLLGQMFEHPTLIAPSTTLAHQAAIPVLIRDEDVIILDQHVHSSVQATVKMVKARGVPVELLRHNSLEKLEERIKELRQKHRKIWYMLDGVYSMYGDFAPLKDLYALMNKYEQFQLYVDDAHGMSWTGKNGAGYALSQIDLHPQMILLTSLNKAFASAGGAMIFPDNETFRRVRTCGGPLIFSTPIQPPMLGVGIAAAKIHLSNEIYVMQDELQKRINYCLELVQKYNLPLISDHKSPIFFIGTGLPRVGYNMVKRMMQEGYYLSIGLFPAVSMKCTGLRFCINLHHSMKDIENMVAAMAYHYPLALEEEGRTRNDIHRAFKLPLIEEQKTDAETTEEGFLVEHHTSINKINKSEWDALLGDRGSFDWNGLRFLENAFNGNAEPQNNWDFHYFIIRDALHNPVLATFFTVALCKDDMFSPSAVSEEIEKKRQKEPLYMCSKTLMMGSLLTEGNHLYINREHTAWRNALQLLLKNIVQLNEKSATNTITLRDFEAGDAEMRDLLLNEGYIKIDLPDAHVFEKLDWKNMDEYLGTLSSKSRKHVKKYIAPYEKYYDIQLIKEVSEQELNDVYELYLNVKRQSLELNTFNLSKKVFKNMIEDSNWEVMTFTLKEEYNDRKERKPIAVMFSYKTETTYSPMIVGLDYYYLFAYKNYRQSLFQILQRAATLNSKKVFLGFTASIEKQRLGAEAVAKTAYIQINDSFNMEVLELNKIQEHKKEREYTGLENPSSILSSQPADTLD